MTAKLQSKLHCGLSFPSKHLALLEINVLLEMVECHLELRNQAFFKAQFTACHCVTLFTSAN